MIDIADIPRRPAAAFFDERGRRLIASNEAGRKLMRRLGHFDSDRIRSRHD